MVGFVASIQRQDDTVVWKAYAGEGAWQQMRLGASVGWRLAEQQVLRCARDDKPGMNSRARECR
jgi:hypothetical protein